MNLNNFILILGLIFLSACDTEQGASHMATKDRIQSVEFLDKNHTKFVIILDRQPWSDDNLKVIAEVMIGDAQPQVDSNAVYSTMLRDDIEVSRVIINVNKIIIDEYSIWSEESYGLSDEDWLRTNINQLKITVK